MADSTDSLNRGAAGRTVAVVDVGTSSMRMAIAEILPGGRVHTLETLAQGVRLGKDTFTEGEISKSTIEQCVRVLRSYREKLDEYRITDPKAVRVVATSAVREAVNRLAFLDRIYIATGFSIEAIDETEVHRITYRSVQSQLQDSPDLLQSSVVICEVGGGSTELLLVESGEVAYAHSYRLGSLRLREALQGFRASPRKVRQIMEGQIRRTLEQLPQHVRLSGRAEMVALGGDMRFAARELLRPWDPTTLARIDVSSLRAFSAAVSNQDPDSIARNYRVTYPEAETVGPAVLVYLELARLLSLEQVLVSNANLRDGLLQEMVAEDIWTADFRNQIIRSALELGRKYHFDETHARHVARLCEKLIAALAPVHRLNDRAALVLTLAALLHEIGAFVNLSSLHKHSMYLITNSELFGVTKDDLMLIGLVARYHRRAAPKPTHQGYLSLDREQRVAVSKMAAILRVADALDASRSQRIRELQGAIEADRLVITVPHVTDLSLEQVAVQQSCGMFEDIFGLRVLLRGTS
jgi:exopolyphosphatase/guanosine-5'-triphosphate,3'-diphosphate pyrophosphatase